MILGDPPTAADWILGAVLVRDSTPWALANPGRPIVQELLADPTAQIDRRGIVQSSSGRLIALYGTQSFDNFFVYGSISSEAFPPAPGLWATYAATMTARFHSLVSLADQQFGVVPPSETQVVGHSAGAAAAMLLAGQGVAAKAYGIATPAIAADADACAVIQDQYRLVHPLDPVCWLMPVGWSICTDAGAFRLTPSTYTSYDPTMWQADLDAFNAGVFPLGPTSPLWLSYAIGYLTGLIPQHQLPAYIADLAQQLPDTALRDQAIMYATGPLCYCDAK